MFCRSYKKVFPKGARCKFSAQKSFQRECRAKYRRNIRRRSSKDVPKRMQNLYRRNRRRRSSKDVPKWMQNLHRKINGKEIPVVPKGIQRLCVPEWECEYVSSAFITILHHIIISFRIASHHTSYRINDTRMEYGVEFRKLLSKLHEVSFKLQLHQPAHKRGISLSEAWISLFLQTTDLLSLRSMKRREGVFSPKAQKRYVCKFHAS
jgi:hypothetical protein